jgi:demethylmenaquinone methyltransferase/2-methoxy-6-polyprenyl-1,4-benzoquinol methylase
VSWSLPGVAANRLEVLTPAYCEPVTDPVRPHPALTEYYSTDRDRLPYVLSLFNETAHYYDQANTMLSLGTGRWYRRRMLKRAGLRPGMRLLDIAVGTGLVASAAYHVVGGDVDIIGLDPSEQMLQEARRKLQLPIALIQGCGETIPLADASVDFVSIGYALRHLSDLAAAFAEFRRVLRPGGSLLMLEIGLPSGPIARVLAAIYLSRVVPWLCHWLKPRSELPMLMRYHWDTIQHCVAADVILAQLSACGFSDVACHVDLGLFRAYRALEPVGSTRSRSDEAYCSHHYSAAGARSPARSGAR